MSRAKDQYHSEIIDNSAAAEWEQDLDSSLAEQYPNYRSIEVRAAYLEGRADQLLKEAGRLGRELDEFNERVFNDNFTKKAA